MIPDIGSIAVVGGGITAWSAAAALKRRIPSLEVKLVATAPSRDSIADRIISTLPSIHGFHLDLRLTESDTVERAGSGYRLGSLFEGWAEGLPPYVHAYGPYGAQLGTVAFHHLWLRQRARSGADPFDRYSLAAELARTGLAPGTGRQMPNVEYGLQLTLDGYQALLQAFATHIGVEVREGQLANVGLRSSDGFVESLVLGDGSAIQADLFVDCTGPEARIFSELDCAFEDWSQWLPCDRLLMTGGQARSDVAIADRVTATAFGWRWSASSPFRSSSGCAYSSAHVGDEEVARGLLQNWETAEPPIVLRQGRRPSFWLRNCVAVGDAAVRLEPLEWTNLHMVHSQIDRMIAMMPGRDCAPSELAEYNRQCANEADRIRDFVCLHYVCARRTEPFWAQMSEIRPPDSLAHTLALFAERGRLPFYEEETFSRDSWLAVLLGQGHWPRRDDPLVDAIAEDDAAHLLAGIRKSLRSLPGAITVTSEQP